MFEIENVSLEELQTLVDEVDENVPTQRQLNAIGRKLDLSTDTLSELNDISAERSAIGSTGSKTNR